MFVHFESSLLSVWGRSARDCFTKDFLSSFFTLGGGFKRRHKFMNKIVIYSKLLSEDEWKKEKIVSQSFCNFFFARIQFFIFFPHFCCGISNIYQLLLFFSGFFNEWLSFFHLPFFEPLRTLLSKKGKIRSRISVACFIAFWCFLASLGGRENCNFFSFEKALQSPLPSKPFEKMKYYPN